MNAAQLLARTQEILNERGWIRGCAETKFGVCLVQALNIASREMYNAAPHLTTEQTEIARNATMHLAWAIEVDTTVDPTLYAAPVDQNGRWQIVLSRIIQWNDRYARTYEDVANALQKAIAVAEVKVPGTVPANWSVPEPAGV